MTSLFAVILGIFIGFSPVANCKILKIAVLAVTGG